MNSSKKFSFDLNLMFNEKIIQHVITVALWVQTLGNQANAPYSSIASEDTKNAVQIMLVSKISVSQSQSNFLI